MAVVYVNLDTMIMVRQFVNVYYFVIIECHYSCQTCNSSGSSQCTLCSAAYNRTLSASYPNTCLCNNGYFDDGINATC